MRHTHPRCPMHLRCAIWRGCRHITGGPQEGREGIPQKQSWLGRSVAQEEGRFAGWRPIGPASWDVLRGSVQACSDDQDRGLETRGGESGSLRSIGSTTEASRGKRSRTIPPQLGGIGVTTDKPSGWVFPDPRAFRVGRRDFCRPGFRGDRCRGNSQPRQKTGKLGARKISK